MDSKIEPVAWMWEIVVDPTGETVIGKTATQFATHRSTGPDDAKPLYTEAALLAAEQRGRESERGEAERRSEAFWKGQLASLTQRVKEVVGPFAREAERYDPPEDDDADLMWGATKLTLAQLRAARDLHDELTQETK